MKEFNEENITRRSNLEVSDSLSCYLGHGAQQNPNAYKAFYNFLKEVKPQRILEIGTGMGGFTIFLRLISDDLDSKPYIESYDIHTPMNLSDKMTFCILGGSRNIFNGDYTELDQDIIEYIQRDGVTLVLCDGGNKIKEFNLLSQFIKSGDFIMAHDYASSVEYFNESVNRKLWNWLEIQDLDIEQACIKQNLQPFMAEEFQEAVWVCKIKN